MIQVTTFQSAINCQWSSRLPPSPVGLYTGTANVSVFYASNKKINYHAETALFLSSELFTGHSHNITIFDQLPTCSWIYASYSYSVISYFLRSVRINVKVMKLRLIKYLVSNMEHDSTPWSEHQISVNYFFFCFY